MSLISPSLPSRSGPGDTRPSISPSVNSSTDQPRRREAPRGGPASPGGPSRPGGGLGRRLQLGHHRAGDEQRRDVAGQPDDGGPVVPGATESMQSVANIVSSSRSYSSTRRSVPGVSPASRPARTSARQATRRHTPSAASAGPRPHTSPISACTHRHRRPAPRHRSRRRGAVAARRQQVPGGDVELRVGDRRQQQQATLQPGVLRGVDPRRLQLTLDLLGAEPFHREPHHPVQQVPGDNLALEQVVLGAGQDRFRAEAPRRPRRSAPPPRSAAGAHAASRARPAPASRAARGRAARRRPRRRALGLRERACPAQGDIRARVLEHLLDDQRVRVVVLDEQNTAPFHQAHPPWGYSPTPTGERRSGRPDRVRP